jgi:hypothetical protein
LAASLSAFFASFLSSFFDGPPSDMMKRSPLVNSDTVSVMPMICATCGGGARVAWVDVCVCGVKTGLSLP